MYETEYKRKFLVIIDETVECDRALTFAAYRVKRTGGTVVLMTIVQAPEFIGLGGEGPEQIEQVINQDRDIAILVLAASSMGEGPGPLVTHFAIRAHALPIPFTVVPGHMSDAEIIDIC